MDTCKIKEKYCYDDRPEYSKDAVRNIKIETPIEDENHVYTVEVISNLLFPLENKGAITDCIVTIDLIEEIIDEQHEEI